MFASLRRLLRPVPTPPSHLAGGADRLAGTETTHSVCPYCAVGCGLRVHVRDGAVVHVEGDPESPINEGTLCPKGAGALQLAVNPHRLTRVLHRAPRGRAWREVPLAWAMDRIAELVWDTRARRFVEQRDGVPVRQLPALACLGGAVFDNEENYLLVKLMRALGVVHLENQARV